MRWWCAHWLIDLILSQFTLKTSLDVHSWAIARSNHQQKNPNHQDWLVRKPIYQLWNLLEWSLMRLSVGTGFESKEKKMIRVCQGLKKDMFLKKIKFQMHHLQTWMAECWKPIGSFIELTNLPWRRRKREKQQLCLDLSLSLSLSWNALPTYPPTFGKNEETQQHTWSRHHHHLQEIRTRPKSGPKWKWVAKSLGNGIGTHLAAGAAGLRV